MKKWDIFEVSELITLVGTEILLREIVKDNTEKKGEHRQERLILFYLAWTTVTKGFWAGNNLTKEN